MTTQKTRTKERERKRKRDAKLQASRYQLHLL
jgi:hypothetical protein